MKNESKLNVLVVEDNKLNGEVLSKYIKANVDVEEMEVQTIHQAERLLDEIKVKEVKPHIVILSEPAQDKIKFTDEIPSRIKQIKKVSPASEVIILSTPNKVETILENFRAGAFDVVVKDEHGSKNITKSIQRFFNNQTEKVLVGKQREHVTTY